MKIPIEIKKLDILKYIKEQAAHDQMSVSDYCSGIIVEAVSARRAAELRHDQLADKYSGLDAVFGKI